MASVLVVLAPSAAASVDFRMEYAGTMLRPVIVRATAGRYTGRLAGFYERLESGLGGHFVTRDDIEQGNPRLLTDILRRVAGLEVLRGTRVRMRGRTCAPLVWLDGIAMPSGEVDLNSFPPSSIEGIELYLTASGAPQRYQGTVDRSRCGTILLWSRGPDTEMRRRPAPTPAQEFEQRYAHRDVFTAAEVDVAARRDTTSPLAVVYPPELFADRVGGSVVVEVVVDTAGRIEAGTFGILFSSHPLFARAVQDALHRAVFHAAVLDGRRVPQIVQIPFRFDPPGTDTSQKRD
jgi:TonB family protein